MRLRGAWGTGGLFPGEDPTAKKRPKTIEESILLESTWHNTQKGAHHEPLRVHDIISSQ